MGKAQVNIVLGNEGLAAAKYLQEKFGTPYVYAVPYGYNGTLSFLAQVGEAAGFYGTATPANKGKEPFQTQSFHYDW